MSKTIIDDSDREVLQQLIRWWRQQHVQRPNNAVQTQADGQTPDVYLIITPTGGVPARTGTVLGTASCDIYQEIDGVVERIGESQDVLNAGIAINAGVWCLVVKDKWGGWFITMAFNGTTPIDAQTGTGDGIDIISSDGSISFDKSVPGVYDLSVNFPDDIPGTGTDERGVVAINDDFTARQYIRCEDGSILVDNSEPGVTKLSVVTYDQTGTGTSEEDGGICPAITIEEVDIRCEGTALNLYRRTVWLDIVSGCLTKKAGSYTFVRTLGCCEDTCTKYWWCMSATGTSDDLCLELTTPEKDALLALHYVLRAGPFGTQTECMVGCADTGTGNTEYWWCMSPPADTGTGTFGGDTGTGTGVDNAMCLQMAVWEKDQLVEMGWVVHGSQHATYDECITDCSESVSGDGLTCEGAVQTSPGQDSPVVTIFNSLPASQNWYTLSGSAFVFVTVNSLTPGGVIHAYVYSNVCGSLNLLHFIPDFNTTTILPAGLLSSYLMIEAVDGGMGGSITYKVTPS